MSRATCEHSEEDCNVKGPDQFSDVLEQVLCGSYQVSYENAETLIKDQDLFILCFLEDVLTTAVPEYTKVIHSTALLYANSVDGFSRSVTIQNAQNDPTNNLLPVMPQELIQMRPFEFSQIVLLHKQQLEVSMSEYDIVKTTDEFKQLRIVYQSEVQTKSIINGFNYKTSFEHGWRPFIDQFPALCAFTGGLASVFPATGTVVLRFSIQFYSCESYICLLVCPMFQLEYIFGLLFFRLGIGNIAFIHRGHCINI